MDKSKGQVFQKRGFACYVNQESGEPYEHFLERGFFVVSQKIENEKDYDEANKFSKIYMNVKMNRCEYSPEVMNKLAEFEKLFFVR